MRTNPCFHLRNCLGVEFIETIHLTYNTYEGFEAGVSQSTVVIRIGQFCHEELPMCDIIIQKLQIGISHNGTYRDSIGNDELSPYRKLVFAPSFEAYSLQ